MGLGKMELKRVFKKYHQELVIYANTFLRDKNMSKDVVQEVFINIWKSGIGFNSEKHIDCYLYKSVKNKALNYIKAMKHRNKVFTDHGLELQHQDSILYSYLSDDTDPMDYRLDRLRKLLNKLPQKMRQCVILGMHNFSNNQIANILSISINTVKDHKKSGYKRLREWLLV